MRPSALQTTKPSAARSRSSVSSKRSDSSSSSIESESSGLDSGDPKPPKIVAKSLNADFSAVSEEEEAFLDPPVSTPDRAEKPQISTLVLTSGSSDRSGLVKERLREALIVSGGGSDGLRKCLDDLFEIWMGMVGTAERKGEGGFWSDPVFWAKVRLGIVAFLACWAAVLCVLLGSEVCCGDRTSFSGSPPT